ncbi:MAG: prenyltransferase/squalene oxidase repeat-containing protein [Gemmataceae bacterium]
MSSRTPRQAAGSPSRAIPPSPGVSIPQEVEFARPPRRLDKRFLLLFLLLPLFYWMMRSSAPGAEELALVSLKELQRNWFQTEGLGRGTADPDHAFQQLIYRQRDWWNTQGLSSKSSPGDQAALVALEKRQKQWWDEEGLAKGKAIPDQTGALDRLDKINRAWFQQQALAATPVDKKKATQTESVTVMADAGPPVDLPEVELVKNNNLDKFFAAGGSQDSEQAVSAGLQWLAEQQRPDGSWSLNGKAGNPNNPNAATAFALLPFLARGETHKTFNENIQYTKVVEKGIHFLMQQQKPDGDLRGGANMYTHAVATLALCEAFNMTSDPVLKPYCQKALDFIIAAQELNGGGWRYNPKQAGDTSVTSWQVQALKSGFLGGLHVPRETWLNAMRFLDGVAMPSNQGYGYVRGVAGHSNPRPATMTACGLLCQQYLHGNERSIAPTNGIDLISASPPADNRQNMYYYYYATQVLFNLRDDPQHRARWDAWNPQMRDLLVRWQDKSNNSELRGSWPAMMINTGGYGGRLVTTSMALLTLEVYYRHLPLNRPSLGDAAKRLEK